MKIACPNPTKQRFHAMCALGEGSPRPPPEKQQIRIQHPKYQDSEFLALLRREQIYQKCKEEGKKCPWEYQEGMPRPFEEMPVSVEDKLYAAADYVNEIAELVVLGLFQEEKVTSGLLRDYNALKIAMNNLEDVMKRKEYLTRDDDAIKLIAYNYIRGEKRYSVLT